MRAINAASEYDFENEFVTVSVTQTKEKLELSHSDSRQSVIRTQTQSPADSW